MQDEIIASSFPCDKVGYSGSIPTLILPKSKYSSTETEFTSDNEENSNVDDCNGKISLSGISTSAASSAGSSRRRRRRRRIPSNRISSSSLNLSFQSEKSGSTDCNIISKKSHREMYNVNGKGLRHVSALTSINDLKHAIGRHRGISGSCAPAIDSALFSMFYLTDVFDGLLVEDNSQYFLYSSTNRVIHGKNPTIKKDLISLLRKEIVYSLRINYFCPASKVVKLVQLIEKHYPLGHIQDSADFLDLLFGEFLKSPPFLNYSNGATGFVHPINLESYLARKYYYQPLALTIQNILRQSNVFPFRDIKKNLNSNNSNSTFSTVPYPALILKVERNVPTNDNDNGSMYYWDNSTETHHHHHKRPVIPNLEIDITDLMASRSSGDNGSNWNENNSVSMESFTSTGNNFSYDPDNTLGGQVGVNESRFVKGLKSACKVMFKYLEELADSSSRLNPPEAHSSPSVGERGLRNDIQSQANTFSPGRYDNNEKYYELLERNDHLISSSSPSLSFRSTSTTHLQTGSKNDLRESLSSYVPKVKVKMELIAVICKSRRKIAKEDYFGINSGTLAGGYSVYCKAGSDRVSNTDCTNFVPWVLYQPRNGVAPQVTLIENFGTWIDSLERHHERLSLYNVPLEIRTVLEDSRLLIYRRIEK